MRGIYIFPNLFTAANLAFGFWAIALLAGDEPSHLVKAAWLILFANVFDTMDGKVARWTNSQSKFGVEFDSLADLVAFGVAPAVLMLKLALLRYGDAGVFVALLFVTCGALRLARFNVAANTGTGSSSYFLGCPIPAASTFLASLVLYDVTGHRAYPDRLYLILTVVCSVLMISNIPYPSAKKSKSGRLTVKLLLLAVVVLAMFTWKQDFIFLVATCYMASGILWKIARLGAKLPGHGTQLDESVIEQAGR